MKEELSFKTFFQKMPIKLPDYIILSFITYIHCHYDMYVCNSLYKMIDMSNRRELLQLCLPIQLVNELWNPKHAQIRLKPVPFDPFWSLVSKYGSNFFIPYQLLVPFGPFLVKNVQKWPIKVGFGQSSFWSSHAIDFIYT